MVTQFARNFLLASSTAMTLTGLAAGSTTPLEYERYVTSFSEIEVNPGDERIVDLDELVFLAEGSIDDTRSSSLSFGQATTEASAWQTSTVTPEGFSFDGGISGSTVNPGDVFICQTSGGTIAKYRFEVDEVTPFHISGIMDATGGGSVVLRLDAAFGGPNYVLEFSQSDVIDVDHTGELPPGTYLLRIEVAAYISPGDEISAAISLQGTWGSVPCVGDLDGSGEVDVADMLDVIVAWGTAAGDVTGDGMTDVADLLMVLAAWGACP